MSHAGHPAAQEMVQVLPLSVNTPGFGFVPVWDPLNPSSTLPPGWIVPFHGALVTTTDGSRLGVERPTRGW